METTENQQRFTEYYQLANRLIATTEKDTMTAGA